MSGSRFALLWLAPKPGTKVESVADCRWPERMHPARCGRILCLVRGHEWIRSGGLSDGPDEQAVGLSAGPQSSLLDSWDVPVGEFDGSVLWEPVAEEHSRAISGAYRDGDLTSGRLARLEIGLQLLKLVLSELDDPCLSEPGEFDVLSQHLLCSNSLGGNEPAGGSSQQRAQTLARRVVECRVELVCDRVDNTVAFEHQANISDHDAIDHA